MHLETPVAGQPVVQLCCVSRVSHDCFEGSFELQLQLGWGGNLTVASLDPAAPATVAGVEIAETSGVRIKGLSVLATAGTVTDQAGIAISHSADVTAEGCKIQGFSAGIKVDRSEGVVLEDNTLSGNGAAMGVGVWLEAGVAAVVYNNLVTHIPHPG